MSTYKFKIKVDGETIMDAFKALLFQKQKSGELLLSDNVTIKFNVNILHGKAIVTFEDIEVERIVE